VLFDRDGAVYAVDASGGDPTLVLDGARCPRVARDGKHLAFLRGSAPSSEVWTARVDGSEARRLVAGG